MRESFKCISLAMTVLHSQHKISVKAVTSDTRKCNWIPYIPGGTSPQMWGHHFYQDVSEVITSDRLAVFLQHLHPV